MVSGINFNIYIMETKEQIKHHFATAFCSGAIDLTDTELQHVVDSDCKCDCCGLSIYEMEDFPVFRDEGFYCEHCEIDKFYDICPICQNHFEMATNPEDFYLIISKEAVEEYAMEISPGFYQTMKWPFFLANCVTGFDCLWPDTLKLIKECDIHSMLKTLGHGSADENLTGEVCQDCLKIWTGQEELKNNYVDHEYGDRYISKQKEVIKQGY